MKGSLNKLLRNYPKIIANAKVEKVEGDVCHVTVLDLADKDIWSCSINAIIENKTDKLIIVPKVGSIVTVAITGDESATIIAVSEVEKVYFKTEKADFTFDKDGFEFNRDGKNLKTVLNDLQDKVGNLCDEVAKIVVSIGVTPDVPAIKQIKLDVTVDNKNDLNTILK